MIVMQLDENVVIPSGARRVRGEMQSRKCKRSGRFGTQVMPPCFNASKITISLFCEQ